MVEIQHNDYWFYEGASSTPLAMPAAAPISKRHARAPLCLFSVGTRHNYPHEISRYLFPFTPIELHHGYLLGKERIITLLRGSMAGLESAACVQVRHFNREEC